MYASSSVRSFVRSFVYACVCVPLFACEFVWFSVFLRFGLIDCVCVCDCV